MTITEKQHDDAVRVLRAEYYESVRSIVEEGMGQIKEGHILNREGLDEYIDQSVDGSHWVIYTHANFQVIFVSDNHDAYMEDFGEAPVSGNDINWAALAYAAMKRDVYDLIGAYNEEIEALLDPEEEEEEELDEAQRHPQRQQPREPHAQQAQAPAHRPAWPTAAAPRKKAPRRKKTATHKKTPTRRRR